ncbi:protein LDOC1-like [Ambystoma mexicanum]|uniref:protein LDOC1-like n=1 Tax=Ambystoma mexicanum TaxID=8296 RepID=UPI0037E808BB
MTMEQIKQLVTAVQSLTQEVQTLKQENFTLKQQMVRPPSAGEIPHSPLPSRKYDRNSHKLKEFLEACIVQFSFKAAYFQSDRDKVGHFIANLFGAALAWDTPLVTAKNPILDSYLAFVNTVKAMFERQEITFSAEVQLMDIKQGNTDLLSYITGFKQML